MAGEIFISYRRADVAWARLLHDQLKAEGVEAWYDALVGAGQDWRIATAKALEAAQIFVLLFSENASQSSDIAKELAAATLEKKLIIPVRLQNIAPKGAFLYELASRNWVNAYEDTDTKLAELAKGLAHLVRTGARDESVLPFDRTPSARKAPIKSVLVAVAAIIILAATILLGWLLWPDRKWTIESSRPFISTLALEEYPAISPNGATLAYTAAQEGGQHKIYVRSLAGGAAVRITNDAYDDVWPSWSSDGARIAFVAIKPGEPCRMMVVTVPAGEEREAGRCGVYVTTMLTWQRGTPFVYYLDGKDFGDQAIFRFDLDTGERLKLPYQADRSIRDRRGSPIIALRASPDGKSLAYLDGDGIKVRDLADDREKVLGKITRDPFGSWENSITWTEDSRTILATSSNGIGSEILAFPVNSGTPYRVYVSAIPVSRLSAGGGLLAVQSEINRKNLARASPTPIGQPDILEPVNDVTQSPTFAPDGTLAFISNRSGTNAIWIRKPGTAAAMLFDAGAAPLFRVNFSPDGTHLAAALFASGERVNFKILTTDGASIASFSLPSVGAGLPTWTPDGKALIAYDRAILRAVRIEISNPGKPVPVAPRLWQGITIRPDGMFATRYDRPGIWQIDKGIRLINGKYPSGFQPPIAFKGDDVLMPDFNNANGPRILAQPLAGGPDQVIAYAPGAGGHGNSESKIAVNPRTGEIIYVASVLSDKNIDLLTLSRH